jgi:hypothetical protein
MAIRRGVVNGVCAIPCYLPLDINWLKTLPDFCGLIPAHV